MDRRLIWIVVASLLVLGARFDSEPPRGIPFVLVGQGARGVRAYTVQGHRVFVRREGSVVTAWDARLANDGVVRWCPYEELFWSRETGDLFDAQGEHARGPSRDNMVKVEAKAEEGILLIDPKERQVGPARNGEIHEDILDFFERYVNQATLPGNRPLIFCPNPVR